MTDQGPIRNQSDFSDRFGITAGRAIRKRSDEKRSEKRSETDQTSQKKRIAANRAIRKNNTLSDRQAIRKTPTPLGVGFPTPREVR